MHQSPSEFLTRREALGLTITGPWSRNRPRRDWRYTLACLAIYGGSLAFSLGSLAALIIFISHRP